MMTESLLRQLQRLDREATPGPWTPHNFGGNWQCLYDGAAHVGEWGGEPVYDRTDSSIQREPDCQLVALCRNNLHTILRALAIAEAVEEAHKRYGSYDAATMLDRADELLREQG